ncbi:MAG TPA: bacteriohemerythrin [Spirochaetota bacterium]|nr:bacteriohemerythrin [Spirochaetota bacterium]
MEMITWDDSLSVGVQQFDAEHRELIKFVNKLNQSLKIGGAQKTMEDILTGLIKYTVIHFTHEEDYMVLYEYPGYDAHRKEHEELKKKVTDFHERFTAQKAAFSLELMIFLRDWLINHIQKSDMAYKDFFQSKGV